ncbi:RNA-binding transcriptional accessory protein [Thiocapsa imhoffii]|uniref:RNA-binding transcriptional accessory protein n=1 Tax=Thiocapsa imhoffii TaxID=382777 RepID=A0A9X1B9V0_9GAMM|nr:Tex family protein [Thiocapsa imhoffii]MBK1645693.1 RNA-binding transcriptional accessory protein [Thiocapsa imhoffii]
MISLIHTLSQELAARPEQVDAAIRLLDEGATVPFIARYRKEATGGLDDVQLRLLEERLAYLRALQERRDRILKSLVEQDKLTPELDEAILAATTKQRLEDLYLPHKPKRRTKAQMAREAGLEPLADALLGDPSLAPDERAGQYLNPVLGVESPAAALEGARQILMERFAEDAVLSGRLREQLWGAAILVSTLVPGKEHEGAKFTDYFAYQEPLARIPSHRALALFRGRNQGILQLELLTGEGEDPDASYRGAIAECFGIRQAGRPGDDWLLETVRKAWRIKLLTRLELELKGRLFELAEEEAIRVFGLNLKALLLAAPAGRLPTMGLDPGLRTGVKVAVVDGTGRVVVTETIYPHAPRNQWDVALDRLATLARVHDVKLVSIGNGTASRETDRLVRALIQQHSDLKLRALVVSEAGASVYSASEFASKELPELDVSLRGAVSIARRLQDPLAELVKIEPKAIGVGQYQHDVNQSRLARTLEAVVEDCVNAVGVDLNTASVPLLTQVSGLNRNLAEQIVHFREAHGPFPNRKRLMAVPRFGEKAFQQSAGFLRVRDGDEPLDASAVHPEAYPLVRRILDEVARPITALIGDRATLRQLDPARFATETFGVPTVRDILNELEKPGRDPRPEFKTARLQDGVETIADLSPGMILEGTVTNVTNFGAFVDIGVHQDGLVHISALTDRFVKDPHAVVKSGDLVKVKVLSVDELRKRIALSMRLGDDAERRAAGAAGADSPRTPAAEAARRGSPDRAHHQAGPGRRSGRAAEQAARTSTAATGGAMADAFAKAKQR